MLKVTIVEVNRQPIEGDTYQKNGKGICPYHFSSSFVERSYYNLKEEVGRETLLLKE